jgi:YegS/Rv2252/BmrU family lipid kinase
LNPATGSVPLRRIRQLLRNQARKSGIALEFAETERADHATEIVRARGAEFDAVIAIGGDGTVSEVVAGAIGTDLVIGIVPTGSTNMVAKELGIPRLLSHAVRVALTSSNTISMDVATAGDVPFIHMGGAGFDAAIMRETPRTLKRIFRWMAYIGPGLAQLRRNPFRVRLEVDGELFIYSARMVLLALGGSIVHPRFRVGDGIDRTDGVLDVVVFDPPQFLQVATTFAWMAIRKPERSAWHHHHRCVVVDLQANEPVPFELDGSYRGELPLHVEMLSRGVFVRVPAVPTPGEIEAHLNARHDLAKAEYEIAAGRIPV